MVVAGDHVFGAEVHQRDDRRSVERQQIACVLRRHAVRAHHRGRERAENDNRRDTDESKHVYGLGVSLVIEVARMPFGPFVHSLTVPSANRWRKGHTISALSRGLRATNENSANSPGGMFIVQMMPTMRVPSRLISCFQPFGTATASTITPSGMSISAATVATLLSVGTVRVYLTVPPAIAVFGAMVMWAYAVVTMKAAKTAAVLNPRNVALIWFLSYGCCPTCGEGACATTGRPKCRYNTGTTIMLSAVELARPKRMTIAIGA